MMLSVAKNVRTHPLVAIRQRAEHDRRQNRYRYRRFDEVHGVAVEVHETAFSAGIRRATAGRHSS